MFGNWDFGCFIADFTVISAVCRMLKQFHSFVTDSLGK